MRAPYHQQQNHFADDLTMAATRIVGWKQSLISQIDCQDPNRAAETDLVCLYLFVVLLEWPRIENDRDDVRTRSQCY